MHTKHTDYRLQRETTDYTDYRGRPLQLAQQGQEALIFTGEDRSGYRNAHI